MDQKLSFDPVCNVMIMGKKLAKYEGVEVWPMICMVIDTHVSMKNLAVVTFMSEPSKRGDNQFWQHELLVRQCF